MSDDADEIMRKRRSMGAAAWLRKFVPRKRKATKGRKRGGKDNAK